MAVDITDQLIAAIQSYSGKIHHPEQRLILMALSEDMANHIIQEIGLKQVWDIGWIGENSKVDPYPESMWDDNTDRESAIEAVLIQQSRDADYEALHGPQGGRHDLVTRLVTPYVVDPEGLIAADKELVELASQEL